MGNLPPDKIDFSMFVRQIGGILARLIKERAHAELVVTIHEGNVKLVRVNRSFSPTGLPEG